MSVMIGNDIIDWGSTRRQREQDALRERLRERFNANRAAEETDEEYLERLGAVEIEDEPDLEPWVLPTTGFATGAENNTIALDSVIANDVVFNNPRASITLNNPDGDDVTISPTVFNHPVIEELKDIITQLVHERDRADRRLTGLEERYNNMVDLHAQQVDLIKSLREDQKMMVEELNEIRRRRR